MSTLKAPEAAPAPATSVHPEPVRLPTGADILHDAVFDGAVPMAASDGMAGDRAIIVPAAETRPGREWERRAGDLPRGERWKRRLPEVCRQRLRRSGTGPLGRWRRSGPPLLVAAPCMFPAHRPSPGDA